MRKLRMARSSMRNDAHGTVIHAQAARGTTSMRRLRMTLRMTRHVH
jgi:hypothetical protein